MTQVTESMLSRFRDHTATESDLRAILLEDRASANPCPDLEASISPILWQLERMDCLEDGRAPLMCDAMAVLASLPMGSWFETIKKG